MIVLIFWVAPMLNEAFGENTEVNEVDPASDPAAAESASKV